MHTNTMTGADHAALENLWGEAGSWAAATWTHLNVAHFDGQLRYHGIIWGLTPHGGRLGHTSETGRITLHPALLDPRGDAWRIRDKLGTRYAEDTLLHEMTHVWCIDTKSEHDHNSEAWCNEIVRITPALGLPPIKAVPVKPRRINGTVTRQALDGHLSRRDIAHWPHSIRPADFYDLDTTRLRVLI
ncbi:MAG: hypothetical protein QOG19_2863 [Mycobacterium sp.]|nr:hypothetical protein [Mycobacterium sp.]